jgi:hypothetical protein
VGPNPTIGCICQDIPKMHKTDTTSEAHKMQSAFYRRMTTAKKLELIFDAYETGRQLSMAGIRMQYPDADEKQVWHI